MVCIIYMHKSGSFSLSLIVHTSLKYNTICCIYAHILCPSLYPYENIFFTLLFHLVVKYDICIYTSSYQFILIKILVFSFLPFYLCLALYILFILNILNMYVMHAWHTCVYIYISISIFIYLSVL